MRRGHSEIAARLDAEQAQWQRREEKRMRARMPYRAAEGCEHWRIVETTCDKQHAPSIDSEGRVYLAPFCIRVREFACADCGVGVWPNENTVREAAPSRPCCTHPLCDCDFFEMSE